MHINSVSNGQHLSKYSRITSTGHSQESPSFEELVNNPVISAHEQKTSFDHNKINFSNMTRQGLFDWMNEQIRSGEMTLDESTPFLGMTLKVSAETGQPVDMATDTSHINFIEKARLGIEAALSRHDNELARRYKTAVEIMEKYQAKRAL